MYIYIYIERERERDKLNYIYIGKLNQIKMSPGQFLSLASVPSLLDLSCIVVNESSVCKDTATQVQILDKIDCISHSTNTLGKVMNPIILPPAMGK